MSEPVIRHKKPQVKPTGYLRRKPIIRELVEKGEGYLTDQSANHEVKIKWKLNKQAQKDKVFQLQVGDNVIYLDLEELTYYTRIMF